MPFPNWIVGVLLACMASVISNLGLNLQKLNHLRNDRLSHSASTSNPASRSPSAPASPYFPPYTIPRSPPSASHKALSIFKAPAIPLKPTQASPQSAPPAALPPSRFSYQSLASPTSSLPSPSTTTASPSHPLLPTQPSSPLSYHRQSLWRIGLALVVLGSFADFTALIFAAQSIIAPLGSLTLVSNTVLAPLLLKESVTALDVLATVAIVVGSSLSVACADHRDRLYSQAELFSLFVRPRFLAYLAVVGCGVFALYSCVVHIGRIQAEAPSVVYRTYRRQHRFCYAALSGVVGAQSVLLAKCVGTLLVATLSGDSVLLLHWQSYCIFALLSLSVVVQIHYLNEGLRQFTSTYIIPVYQSFWILTSTVSGLIFFTEYRGVFDEPATAIGFPVGVLITVAGVYVLSQRGGADDMDDEATGANSVDEGAVRAGEQGGLRRAQTQPLEHIATFPSASSSSFFLLGFDGRRGGRAGTKGWAREWENELHTAPVLGASGLYMPLSASVPSTSMVPGMEEEEKVREDSGGEKRREKGERKSGGQATQQLTVAVR